MGSQTKFVAQHEAHLASGVFVRALYLYYIQACMVRAHISNSDALNHAYTCTSWLWCKYWIQSDPLNYRKHLLSISICIYSVE